jgi:hypothetical protein
VKPDRLLQRLREGQLRNVRFSDFQRLLERCGFRLIRTRGSHHIYTHPQVGALLNLQDMIGEAKPYQIRQFLRTIDEHSLYPEDET